MSDLGLPIPARPRPWTREEDQILIENTGQMPRDRVVSLLPGRSYHGTEARALRLGLNGWTYRAFRGINRRYHVALSFFDDPNPQNSYWAGFLAADGCIYGRSVSLASVDRDHLELFARTVGYDGSIGMQKGRGRFGRRPLYRVTFTGVPEWVEALARHWSVGPRKSLSLQPPALQSLECVLPFIRGYIDGDGSVFLVRPKGCTAPRVRLSMVGTRSMVEWIATVFGEIAPAERVSVSRPKGSIWGYDVTGRRAAVIAHHLLADGGSRLSRKWSKVEPLVTNM